MRLGDDGQWHAVDDIHVPALGDDPVEATRRWCDEHRDADLLRLDGVGDRMATEVRDALGRRGLKLKVYERGHPCPTPGDPTVPVEELCIVPYIGHRKTRTLRAAGIATVGDLTRVTAADLLALPKFGTVAVRSIRAWMDGLGFKLKGE